MSVRSRAALVVGEVRKLLFPVIRSLPHRLADRRREIQREQAKPRTTRLFRESALAAAKSLRAPVISG